MIMMMIMIIIIIYIIDIIKGGLASSSGTCRSAATSRYYC